MSVTEGAVADALCREANGPAWEGYGEVVRYTVSYSGACLTVAIDACDPAGALSSCTLADVTTRRCPQVEANVTCITSASTGGYVRRLAPLEVCDGAGCSEVCDDGFTVKEAQAVCAVRLAQQMPNFTGMVPADIARNPGGVQYLSYSRRLDNGTVRDMRCPANPITSLSDCTLSRDSCSGSRAIHVHCGLRNTSSSAVIGLAPLRVRLAGTSTGNVCGHGFDQGAADFVCRYYHAGAEMLRPATWTAASLDYGYVRFDVDQFHCDADAASFDKCTYRVRQNVNCTAGDAVNVTCYPPAGQIVSLSPLQVCTPASYCGYVLASSPVDHPTAVGLCSAFNGGYFAGSAFAHAAEVGTSRYAAEDIHCPTNADSLANCSYDYEANTYSGGFFFGSSTEGVSVQCNPFRPLRFPDTAPLRACNDDFVQCGYVCDDRFSDAAARMVCASRHNGTFFGTATWRKKVQLPPLSSGGANRSDGYLVDDLTCRPGATDSTECTYVFESDCDRDEGVSVFCDGVPPTVSAPARHASSNDHWKIVTLSPLTVCPLEDPPASPACHIVTWANLSATAAMAVCEETFEGAPAVPSVSYDREVSSAWMLTCDGTAGLSDCSVEPAAPGYAASVECARRQTAALVPTLSPATVCDDAGCQVLCGTRKDGYDTGVTANVNALDYICRTFHSGAPYHFASAETIVAPTVGEAGNANRRIFDIDCPPNAANLAMCSYGVVANSGDDCQHAVDLKCAKSSASPGTSAPSRGLSPPDYRDEFILAALFFAAGIILVGVLVVWRTRRSPHNTQDAFNFDSLHQGNTTAHAHRRTLSGGEDPPVEDDSAMDHAVGGQDTDTRVNVNA